MLDVSNFTTYKEMTVQDFVLLYKQEAAESITETGSSVTFTKGLKKIRNAVKNEKRQIILGRQNDGTTLMKFNKQDLLKAVDTVMRDNYILTQDEFVAALADNYPHGQHQIEVQFHKAFPDYAFTSVGMVPKAFADPDHIEIFKD